MTHLPFQLPSSAHLIVERRAQILTFLCSIDDGFRQTPVRSIHMKTLSAMLDAYDVLFFENTLKRAYAGLKVTLSSRMTSSAGKFIYIRNQDPLRVKAEIRMSSDFLVRLEHGPFLLNGLTAQTPQEAFLMVFEHELCHALEVMLYRETGHSNRFLSLANSLFGHTEVKHSLPTRRAEAARDGIRVGAVCSFVYQERTLSGRITHIGKKATVMVQSYAGEYRDSQGRRYSKYYVPLECLHIR